MATETAHSHVPLKRLDELVSGCSAIVRPLTVAAFPAGAGGLFHGLLGDVRFVHDWIGEERRVVLIVGEVETFAAQ